MIEFTLSNLIKKYSMYFVGFCCIEFLFGLVYCLIATANIKKAKLASEGLDANMDRLAELSSSIVSMFIVMSIIFSTVLIITNAMKLVRQDYDDRSEVLKKITIGIVLIFVGFVGYFAMNVSFDIDEALFGKVFSKSINIILLISFFAALIPASLLIVKFVRSKNLRYVTSLYIKESKESKFTHFKFIYTNGEILYAHSLEKNLMEYFA